MKTLCIIFRKKWILLTIVAIVVFSSILVFSNVMATSTPKPQYTIVIDAGHGGKDGGAVGRTTGVTESYLNLQYALLLKDIFEQFDFNVVLTRSDMNGLYSTFSTNKKKSEMEKRKKIIDKADPDIVISVHMNSFKSDEGRGAQVFYAKGNDGGELLAQSVQDSLFSDIEYAKATAKVGDYYVLNAIENPSILVECGFLSNPEEEVLLQEEEYMQKFCYNVFCGVIAYLKMA